MTGGTGGDATELIKIPLVLIQNLLFFKEGGSEENSLFQKSVVSSEGLSHKVWEGGCLPAGWARGNFFKSFLRTTGQSRTIIEIDLKNLLNSVALGGDHLRSVKKKPATIRLKALKTS